MTDTHDPTSDSPLPAQGRGRWLYLFLLTLETVGAVLLYWEGLPIYRSILANNYTIPPKTSAMALGSAALIQVAYWLRYQLRPQPPRYVNVLLGHVVLFLSRIIFLLPGAVFSVLFIAKTLEVQAPVTKYAFILLALFSLFCYVRELERLGEQLTNGRLNKGRIN